MIKIRIAFFSILFAPLLCFGQVSPDVYRNYGYSIENQFDEVQLNAISYNFGMARRFILQHPLESTSSSENHEVGLSALDKSTQTISLGNSSYGNKISVGYSTWDGTKLGASAGHTFARRHTINATGSIYGDRRINSLEQTHLDSKVKGAFAQANYHYSKKKTTLTSHLVTKTDDRLYTLYDSIGSLNTNQQLLVWNTHFSYKPSINSTLTAYTGLSFYSGNFRRGFVQYRGTQRLMSGGIMLEMVRPTWLMTNSIRIQAIQDIQSLTATQNRLELSNIFQPKLETLSTKLKIRNSIVLTSDNQFYYAPSVAIHYNWEQLKIYANAARSVHTQTNTLERAPYLDATYLGLRNLTIDRFDVHPSFSINRKLTMRGLLSYSLFENFTMANNELKALARANLSIEKVLGDYFTIATSYNYRFLEKGNLGQLAPKHTAFLEIKHARIPSAYLNLLFHKELLWSFDIVGGYRSEHGSIANNVLISDAVTSQYFVDFNYRISRDHYYYTPFEFTFSVRNLFAQQVIIDEQALNASILLSEGMRVARSLNFGLSYYFDRNRY